MNATITLTREAVEQAIKEYVERQGYIVIKLVPPELNPMQILSDRAQWAWWLRQGLLQ